jgi:molybdopterin converting factor small subunit
MVTIELYGVPRLRAGRDAVAVEAGSLGEALAALALACPSLAPSVVEGGRLAEHYVVAHNGLAITADPGLALAAGDVLVLISAEAGG